MSRAFVKEDAAGERIVVPARAPLPDGVPNLVTASGMRALHGERRDLEAARRRAERLDGAAARARALLALDEREAALEERLASARVVPAPAAPDDEVVVGSEVEARRHDGRAFRLRIVGVDEADPSRGRIAFTAPVADALLGRRVGDVVTAAGTRLTVVAVRFPSDAIDAVDADGAGGASGATPDR